MVSLLELSRPEMSILVDTNTNPKRGKREGVWSALLEGAAAVLLAGCGTYNWHPEIDINIKKISREAGPFACA